MTAEEKLWVRQVDIKTAYLYANLDEPLYVQVPEGYKGPKNKDLSNKCLKLLKALPGTKQGAKQWFKTCTGWLTENGYKQLVSEECLFVKDNTIILVYVDYIMIFSRKWDDTNRTVELLQKKFQLTDNGKVTEFLQMEVRVEPGIATLGQSKYIDGKVKEFKQENVRTYSTPMSMNTRFKKLNNPPKRPEAYGSIIGTLLYAQQKTRPDISFAVSSLARFNKGHERMHWESSLRVLNYLKGTKHEKLVYKHKGEWKMKIYVDASYGTGFDGRSVTGYMIMINDGVIAWRTGQQKVTATSAATAEYLALYEVMVKALWIMNVSRELGRPFEEPVVIMEDNQAVIGAVTGGRNSEMLKHLAIKYYFVKEQVQNGKFILQYVNTKDQLADGMTKANPRDKIQEVKTQIGLITQDLTTDKPKTKSGGPLNNSTVRFKLRPDDAEN